MTMTQSGTRTLWYRLVMLFSRFVVNPIAKRLAPRIRGLVVLETVGRTSGLPRRTPLGGRLDGRAFWLISEFGRQANYVRNLEQNPRVRLQIGDVWHTGVARVVEDDDPRARMRSLGWWNSFLVRSIGNEMLSVRIDLDG